MTTYFRREEVEKNCSEDSCWVIVENKVYDVTPFLRDHPGGSEYILKFAGTDITEVLKDSNFHVHSVATFDVLAEYYLGHLDSVDAQNPIKPNITKEAMDIKQTEQVFLDLKKPLFPQLWNATYTREFYLEQVHRARYTPYTVPYFSNPYMDLLSKTNWFIVPMLWLPFVAYELTRATQLSSIYTAFQGMAYGLFFWTILEYGLHRFLFHVDDLLPEHPIAFLLHFTLHGIHHHMPMDRLRLVMPPALTVIISIPVFKLAHTLFALPLAHGFIAGAFFGYICYDMTHYYLHHAEVIQLYFGNLKRYHIAHHYQNFSSGFGVTSKFWDHVFGTVLHLEDKK